MRMEKLLKNIAKKSSDPDEESAPVFKCPKHFPNKNKKTSDQQEEDVMENQVVQKMQNIMITDYERTRYIGSSSGVHLLNQEMFCTNKKHHLSEEPSWFIQKVNHDEEEHIIMKTREIEPSKLVINKQPTIKRFEMFEDVPNMTLELADYLVHRYNSNNDNSHTVVLIILQLFYSHPYILPHYQQGPIPRTVLFSNPKPAR
jgi:hypothetical protein